LRVFVIDDEENIVESMRSYIEQLGHEVFTAPEPLLCDIYQGYSCCEEHACGDLVFVDYNMPRMTGLEFIELMARRGCKGPKENKVLMSGNTSAIDMDKVKALGCQVVQKPLRLARVGEIVEEAKNQIDPHRKLADLSRKKCQKQHNPDLV